MYFIVNHLFMCICCEGIIINDGILCIEILNLHVVPQHMCNKL